MMSAGKCHECEGSNRYEHHSVSDFCSFAEHHRTFIGDAASLDWLVSFLLIRKFDVPTEAFRPSPYSSMESFKMWEEVSACLSGNVYKVMSGAAVQASG